MITMDAKILIGLMLLCVQFACNVVGLWWLRHNIPDLWKELKELRTLYHALDKEKVTREFETREDK